MKTLILAAIALVSSTAAYANPTPDYGVYFPVLSCDNGAVIIENVHGSGRGGDGLGARLTVNDANVVKYFQDAGHSGWIQDGKFIATSFFMPGQAQPLTSFRSNSAYVSQNGDQLLVVSGAANWTFHGCVEKR